MKYNFDEFINRIGTDSEKWESGGHGGVYFDENSLSFSIADMDFALAPAIDKAIRDRLDKKILGYTEVCTKEYRSCVSGWFARRFDWHFDGELMYTVEGVMDGVYLAIEKLTKPGEGVIIQQPVYPPFMRAVNNLGRKIVVNHSRGFSLSFPLDSEFDFTAAQEYISVKCKDMSAVISKEYSTYPEPEQTKQFVDDYLHKYILSDKYMQQNKF